MKHLILGLAASTVMTSAAFAELLDLEKDVLTFGFIKLTDMAPLAFGSSVLAVADLAGGLGAGAVVAAVRVDLVKVLARGRAWGTWYRCWW